VQPDVVALGRQIGLPLHDNMHAEIRYKKTATVIFINTPWQL
jgi:hypothetical protein